MIEVLISNGFSYRIELKGHANYAPSGQDIVCAGVSTLVETLSTFVGVKKEEDVIVLETNDYDLRDYMCFAEQGIRLIAEQYPNNVKVVEEC